MTDALIVLLVALPIILVGAEWFTNAIEHIGAVFGVSEGVTGSLLAAVGTALPETAVPVLASLHSGAGARVAVGAVLGAPLMLSTLTMAVIGLAALSNRGLATPLNPERSGLRRDLNWFLGLFALALLGLFLPQGPLRYILAVILVFAYFAYVFVTVRASSQLVAVGHGTTVTNQLHLARLRLNRVPGLRYVQLVLGLLLILGGAQLFVDGIEELGRVWGVSVLILALVVAPIATELPEKINSVLWVRRRKDTLAFGNVTGAMVYQGSLLPALGMILTPWRATPLLVTSMLVTMTGAGFLRTCIIGARKIRPYHLLASGLLYVAFLGYLLIL
ncbi:MAG: sodium:calcium antiporter [Acidiferrobacter sp.]